MNEEIYKIIVNGRFIRRMLKLVAIFFRIQNEMKYISPDIFMGIETLTRQFRISWL